MQALPFRFISLSLIFGLFFLSSTTLLPSCKSYDAVGLQYVNNIGAKLIALIGKATEPYTQHATEAKDVTTLLQKAQNHAAAQKGNTLVTTAWKALNTGIVEPFLTRWKSGKLDKTVVNETIAQVRASLAAIQKVEQSKK